MRRTSACFGLLLVMLGWGVDDPLQQRVSYDKPGQTLKTLLRDLSAQTNLKLYAAPPLDTEIVLVAVQEMPLKELMEHLAYVVDGEWIDEGEGQHRLARTPKVIAKRRQEDREQALAELREILASEEFRRYLEPLTREEVVERVERIRKQLRELIAENLDEYEVYNKLYELFDKEWEPLSPDRRLVCRILRQMNLKDLVDLPVGERRVFSNVSGRYLLPLRAELAPLLQQWFSERKTLQAVINDPRYLLDKEILEYYDFFWRVEEVRAAQDSSKIRMPEKVYLEVMPHEWRAGFSFLLYLVDGQNRRITTGYYSPEVNWWEAEEERLVRLSKQDSALVQPVEWREETQRWLDAWRMLQSKGEIKPLPHLLDPAKHEPLQFVPSDVVRSYARHKNLPLVALLDDEMLWWTNSALRNRQRVMHFLTLEDTWEISPTDGVLRLKPRLSSLRWRERENREAASRWIRQIVARGYLGLNDTLEAEHQPNLADLYLWHIGTGHFAYLPEASRSILPFLKDLLGQMESRLENKIELPLYRLSPQQIQELERVVYYSYGYVSLLESDEKHKGIADIVHRIVKLPHAHFPNGIPRDATLVCEIKTEDGVLSQRSGVGIWSRFYDVGDLQWFLKDENNDHEHFYYQREFIQNSLLLPVQRQELTLSLRVASYEIVVIRGYEMRGYRPTQGLKPVRWEQLPPEWLKPPNPQEASEDP